MFYPTAFARIPSLKDSAYVTEKLSKIGLRIDYSGIGPLCVDGSRHRVRPVAILGPPTFSPTELVEVYENYYRILHDWIDNLQVGDTVVIEPRKLAVSDYPCHYVDEMRRYEGQRMTIREIHEDAYNDHGYTLRFNSQRTFYMEEDHNAFTWHASMFAFDFQDVKSVNVLKLTEINIESLLKLN